MEGHWPLIRRVGAALAVAAAGGCMSPDQVTHKVTETVNKVILADKPPTPASTLLCFWHRRLSPLPDPTREGAQTLGLPGQAFLITPDSQPAEVTGDLAIVVYDDTPRPPGMPAMRPEVWHYTKDVLKRLTTNDEKFGKSHVLFIPWPAHWRDVTAVRISAVYKSPGNPDLYASEVRVNLDQSGGPVWTDAPRGSNGQPSAATMATTATVVPDPNRLLRETQAHGQPAQAYAAPPPGSNPPGYAQPYQPTPTTYSAPPPNPPGVAPAGYAPVPPVYQPAGTVPQPAVPPPSYPPPGWGQPLPAPPPPAYPPMPSQAQLPPLVAPIGQPPPSANPGGGLQPIIIPRNGT